MEIVQLQCGKCQKLMGVSVAHLGKQVQCPYCRAIVQASSRPAQAVGKSAGGNQATVELKPERESIFEGDADEGEGEGEGEDVIGSSPRRSRQPREPAPTEASLPAHLQDAPDEETDLTAFKPRPLHKPSVLPLIALIFLIPYALMTTGFIAYLLLYVPQPIHPLDILPDPVPSKDKGAPRQSSRQIIHTYPLAEHQVMPLGSSIQVGDLVVTADRVLFTDEKCLELQLRVRNASTSYKFEPINKAYIFYTPALERERKVNKSYTFLESKTNRVPNLYGGYLEYRRLVKGRDEQVLNGEIGPNEEETIFLTTIRDYVEEVAKIRQSHEDYVWRIQVRRGLVQHRGRDVSATAVIGIAFNADQIRAAEENKAKG